MKDQTEEEYFDFVAPPPPKRSPGLFTHPWSGVLPGKYYLHTYSDQQEQPVIRPVFVEITQHGQLYVRYEDELNSPHDINCLRTSDVLRPRGDDG